MSRAVAKGGASMVRMRVQALLIWIGILSGSLLGGTEEGDGLQAGAARGDITPELGGEIIGGFVPIPARHIHDPLHVRALVLDDGQQRIALVVCDLLGLDRQVSQVARERIEAQVEIPASHVMISATHTHSACSALGQRRWRLDQPLDAYQQFVARRIADTVQCATNNLRSAELAYGQVDIPEHVFNRRWFMKPGTVPPNPFGGQDQVKMNPPAGSPNLERPAGPTDPTVSFLSVRGTDGRPVGMLAAYSLHYVGGVRSGDVSADYFAVFCESIEQSLGPPHPLPPGEVDFVAIMANGTSGDINNIDFRAPRGRRAPYEQMHFVGTDVARKVLAVIPELEYRRDIAVRAVYREPEVHWRHPSPDLAAWAERTLADGPQRERDLSYIYAQRVREMMEYPETTTVPLQVLRIGDVCIGTMPAEVFCEIGLEWRRQCPQQPAFMIELAHGYFGYLPTPQQHALGGYETWLGTNRLEVHASEKLMQQLLEMATEVAAPQGKLQDGLE
ncbi:MAG: hypothetical protein D6753_02715 [Planctomycetota bacterium]|nr:MAG: hypothetical protein D6753_02715 [Planctomycetota bacterium]